MNDFSILCVVVLVFVIVLAMLFMSKYIGKEHVGGAVTLLPSDIARSVFARIEPTIAETGDKHINKYLCGVLGVDNKSTKDLLLIAAERTHANSANELIMLLDLRYQWFLSAADGIELSKQHLDKNTAELLIVSLVNSAIGSKQVSPQRYIDKFVAIAQRYKKFVNLGKKKSGVTLDVLAIEGVIGVTVDAASTAPLSTREKLDAINLIELYPREPYLVREFINKIQRQVGVLTYNLTPLERTQNLLTVLTPPKPLNYVNQVQKKLVSVPDHVNVFPGMGKAAESRNAMI